MFHKVTAPLTLVLAAVTVANSQTTISRSDWTTGCVIVPQSSVFQTAQGNVRISGVDVGISIVEQVATTTLEIHLENPGNRPREARLLVPVPDGAVVRSFEFEGTAAESSAQILEKAEARRAYDAIVARAKDPALLEFVGWDAVRSSVFPVPAGGTQKVRLKYEYVLAADGDRVDYVLPRSESLAYTAPWNVAVKIRSKEPVSTVYSPSHAIQTVRVNEREISVKTTAHASREPGSFRLSYLVTRSDVTASLFAYPDPSKDGGYFLLLAGLPASHAEDAKGIRRDLTLVIDCSGSMRGQKLVQALEAARQVIAGLDDGETFNIIAYSEAIDLFSAEPVVKNAETAARADAYLRSLSALSGTNLHDALVESLRQKARDGSLPLVLFLTDGLPTVGVTSETAIRDAALHGNHQSKRVYTFGVGVDVNTPLLDRIAASTRAVSTYVLPQENVEVKVASVFRRLSGPVLANPELDVIGADGKVATSRVRELQPSLLPDLFDGDQLVVLGRYVGTSPINFRLSGNYRGRARAFQFPFDLDQASVRHAFVPRLWASRRIATLVDAIRDLGADSTAMNRVLANTLASARPELEPATQSAPRFKELVDEVVRLSTEFGILTEYTAFLALEGTDLSQRDQVLSTATSNFTTRAVGCRTGVGAVNQSSNQGFMRFQGCSNLRNRYLNERLEAVEVTTVQQVCDRTFYRRGDRWVDSRIVADDNREPDRVVAFGSTEHRDLVERLARENRQGTIALSGDIFVLVGGKAILVEGPKMAPNVVDAE